MLDIGDTADFGVEFEVLSDSHVVEGIELRAHAEIGSRICQVLDDGHVFHEDVTTVAARLNIATDKGNSGRLSGSVGTEQREDLTPLDAKADIVHGGILLERLG
jgi:hypothetical protein